MSVSSPEERIRDLVSRDPNGVFRPPSLQPNPVPRCPRCYSPLPDLQVQGRQFLLPVQNCWLIERILNNDVHMMGPVLVCKGNQAGYIRMNPPGADTAQSF